MHSEFDPDDNFAQAFDAGADLDDEAALEAVIWQLLLIINPGDEDAAHAQLLAWQESLDDGQDVETAIDRLQDVIDWKAGFRVADGDTDGAMEALDELAARWNLRIDWDLDDEDLDSTDVPALLDTAFDRLREHHYTLWLRDMGADEHAGWITRSRDDDAMREIVAALGLRVHPAGG
ncbi:MAG TPA: hypothetical protein VIG88_11455 [Lysobacter sp.]